VRPDSAQDLNEAVNESPHNECTNVWESKFLRPRPNSTVSMALPLFADVLGNFCDWYHRMVELSDMGSAYAVSTTSGDIES